jgi:hypothetical protein
MEEPKATPSHEGHPEEESRVQDKALLALLRLLTREPPSDHDFKTCPICEYYEIEKI